MGPSGEGSRDRALAPSIAERDALPLLLLAGVAGCVYALSYLGLGQVFTANMTGETVAERGRQDVTWPSFVTAALALELAALLALAIGWILAGGTPTGAALHCFISASAFAMGVQSAAVGRLGVASGSTTYATGTLMTLTRRSVDRIRSREAGTAGPPKRGPGLAAGVWLSYLVGAIVGGAADSWWVPGATALPLVFVAAVVLVATRHRGC